jgi:hypothetical protein
MFNVTVSFGDTKQWQFLFHNFDRAEAVIADFTKPESGRFLHVVDDFGNTALIGLDAINGILIENYVKSVDAAIERHMINARAQAKAQSKIAGDPLLRMVGQMNGPMQQGPMYRS